MHVYDTTYSKSHSKGLRTEKVCLKGASHLGELGNVKPIKLGNFGPPPPLLAVQCPVCTAYESPFVSELDKFTKDLDSTFRHDVLGFVFN